MTPTKRFRIENQPERPSKFKRAFILEKDYQVKLNQTEARLCKLLDDFTLYLRSNDSKSVSLDSKTEQDHKVLDSYQSLELRIAGGWVRDKLLGVQTNDLDIGISSLTGLEFAQLFSEYVSSHSGSKNGDDSVGGPGQDESMGKIATIEARPDQSKHLQTATTTFLGLDLDFVQLRTEDYGAHNDSRIPTTVNFGTPLEDALRRDITINSLFYNIHTGLIEDHTEKGLSDLENGLIRTPLPACQTFQDDPLRLLRCIRFATRFQFQLDQDIVLAAQSEPIKQALLEKVSRERFGIEMDKMLKGRDPLSSLEMIEELGLYASVFCRPDGLDASSIEPSLTIQAARWLDLLLDQSQPHSSPLTPSAGALPPLHPELLRAYPSSAHKRRLYLACALLPYRPFQVKVGKKHLWAAEVVLMDGLKFGSHDKSFVMHLFQALELINTARLKDILSSDSPVARLELGRLLRSPHVHDLKMFEGDASLVWQVSFLFALVNQLAALTSTSSPADCQEQAKVVVEIFNRIVALIYELDMPFVVTPEFEKRRLDGKEICQVLGIKPGKHVAKLIDVVVDHQILHPATSKIEASDWLKEQARMGFD